MNDKLQPCPLCGGNELLHGVEYISRGRGIGINIGFVECLAPLCPMIIREETEEQAIISWNTRTIENIQQRKITQIQQKYTVIYKEIAYIKFMIEKGNTTPEEKINQIHHIVNKIIRRDGLNENELESNA